MVVFQSCAQFQPINVDINNYSYEINRDFWGVPHIKGATNKDIAFGIGYVHAEDAYEDLVQLFMKGDKDVIIGFDHPNYKHFSEISKASINELSNDFDINH